METRKDLRLTGLLRRRRGVGISGWRARKSHHSRYPRHSSHRPPSLSASRGSAPPCLSTSSGPGSLPAPPLDAAFSSLFYFFDLSTCACRFEVTVTSFSLPPCVSHRGLFNTNHRLSHRCGQRWHCRRRDRSRNAKIHARCADRHPSAARGRRACRPCATKSTL